MRYSQKTFSNVSTSHIKFALKLPLLGSIHKFLDHWKIRSKTSTDGVRLSAGLGGGFFLLSFLQKQSKGKAVVGQIFKDQIVFFMYDGRINGWFQGVGFLIFHHLVLYYRIPFHCGDYTRLGFCACFLIILTMLLVSIIRVRLNMHKTYLLSWNKK